MGCIKRCPCYSQRVPSAQGRAILHSLGKCCGRKLKMAYLQKIHAQYLEQAEVCKLLHAQRFVKQSAIGCFAAVPGSLEPFQGLFVRNPAFYCKCRRSSLYTLITTTSMLPASLNGGSIFMRAKNVPT